MGRNRETSFLEVRPITKVEIGTNEKG